MNQESANTRQDEPAVLQRLRCENLPFRDSALLFYALFILFAVGLIALGFHFLPESFMEKAWIVLVIIMGVILLGLTTIRATIVFESPGQRFTHKLHFLLVFPYSTRRHDFNEIHHFEMHYSNHAEAPRRTNRYELYLVFEDRSRILVFTSPLRAKVAEQATCLSKLTGRPLG